MNQTLVDKLQAAHDKLTQSTWNKYYFFEIIGDRICMCAHGALQSEVNPCVKSSLNNKSVDYAKYFIRGAAERAAKIGQKNLNLLWSDRPDWIKDNFIISTGKTVSNTGNLDGHYLLGMVGLTAEFNDDFHTTFDMVKAKFKEAIALAKMLQV